MVYLHCQVKTTCIEVKVEFVIHMDNRYHTHGCFGPFKKTKAGISDSQFILRSHHGLSSQYILPLIFFNYARNLADRVPHAKINKLGLQISKRP